MDGVYYSTGQVAAALGITKRTLLRWLYAKEIPEPVLKVGINESRLWTHAELEAAKAYKEQHYRRRS